jgi:hypothetical protein
MKRLFFNALGRAFINPALSTTFPWRMAAGELSIIGAQACGDLRTLPAPAGR